MAAGPLLLPPALSLGACLATSCHAQGGLLFTTIRPLSRGSLLDEPSDGVRPSSVPLWPFLLMKHECAGRSHLSAFR